MTLGHRIEPITYDLNAKCLVSLDVDDRPPPIMKLAHAQHHTQLLATFFMDNPFKLIIANVMKLHAISETLTDIYICCYYEMTTSMDNWFLLQVHIIFMRNMHICKDI